MPGEQEDIIQDGAGTAEFGNEVDYTISRNGDLIHKMYFHLKANRSDLNVDNSKKVSNFGNTLDKRILCFGNNWQILAMT